MITRVNFPRVLEDMYFPQTTGNPKIFKNGERYKMKFQKFQYHKNYISIKLADISK